MGRESLTHHLARLRRAIARYASPTGLALVLLSFGGGFLLVSCDTPGGYGRVHRGGTTSYSGFQLATGQEPKIDEERLRPEAKQQPDRLPVQPLVAVSAICVVVAGGIVLAAKRHRHLLTSAFAVGAAGTLGAGVLHARTLLVDRVAAQATEPLPRGRTAADYVQIGGPFWIALILLGLVAAGHFVATIRGGGDRSGEEVRF
jgi:hypothetical protein